MTEQFPSDEQLRDMHNQAQARFAETEAERTTLKDVQSSAADNAIAAAMAALRAEVESTMAEVVTNAAGIAGLRAEVAILDGAGNLTWQGGSRQNPGREKMTEQFPSDEQLRDMHNQAQARFAETEAERAERRKVYAAALKDVQSAAAENTNAVAIAALQAEVASLAAQVAALSTALAAYRG